MYHVRFMGLMLWLGVFFLAEQDEWLNKIDLNS